MNHAYRLVWNDTMQCQVPAPENARSQGKRTGVKPLAAAMLTAFACNAYALPTGGAISAGAGSVGQSGATMTVNQNTQNLAINWQSFGIGANERVNFNQPNVSAIALNRVLGSDSSQILGQINANGQVWVLNPNGVLFGRAAQVNTGGLVASTLNISDADFLAGKRTFSGNGGSVINQGTLNATGGGYIALLGGQVSNEGIITAQLGTVALAAGDKVTLDFNGDQLLNVQVEQGALDALAQNSQLIRADGGTVLMTAQAADALATAVVNNTGVIEARSIENHNGVIKLLGDMGHGTVNVGGTLDASAPSPQPSPARGEGVTPLSLDGRGAGGEGAAANGGFIETSAAHVKIADGTVVTTHAETGQSGTWLIDPVDFTIASGSGALTTSGIGATTLSTSLGGGNVSIATDAGTAGNGDIFVNAPVSWSANTLKLIGHGNIYIDANLNGSGAAKLYLAYGQQSAAGNGYNYFLRNGAKVSLPAGTNFTTEQGYGADNTILGDGGGTTTPWTVITSLGVEGDATVAPGVMTLQGMHTGLAGKYVLGADIDASGTSTWNANQGFKPVGTLLWVPPTYTPFTGKFDGLGHTISNLSITRVGGDFGLFGATNNAVLQNVGLLNVAISGGENSDTGALAGSIDGTTTVRNCYVDGGSVSSTTQVVGGLVGLVTSGSISYSYAAVSVSAGMTGGAGYAGAGGLVGVNNGAISYSYATGSVSAPIGNPGSVWIGGLAGKQNAGSISYSYATGAVSGNSALGGLLGSLSGGTVTNSYWDKTTTGQGTSSGSNPTSGLTTAEWSTLGPFSSSPSDGAWSAADWGVGNPYPGIKALPYITIAASSSQTYGSAATFGIASILDQSGANASGLVNTGGLTWLTDTTAASAAGTTGNVFGSGAGATGYQILYTASLTVDQAPLTVTASAASKTYDGLAYSGGNGVAYSGWVNGETAAVLGGALAYGGASQGAVNAGSYIITPSGLTSSNYAINFVDGSLTVNKALLTVTANNQSRLYGEANPMFGQTVSGYVNGEDATSANVTGSATGSTAATATTGVGGYTITGSTGTLAAANYDFAAANGTLTINKAHLIVTADNQTRLYGQVNPTFSQTVTGFVNGEDATSAGLTGSAMGSSAATITTGVGNYAITGSTGTLAAANYDFAAANGTLTVNPALLTVTANDAFKLHDGLTWSGGNGVTYSGFVNGETSAILGGALVYGGTSQSAVDAGSYLIAPSGLTAANYAIAFNDGTLSIGQRLPVIPGAPVDSYSGATDREAGTVNNAVEGTSPADNAAGGETDSVKLSPDAAVGSSANQYVLVTQACGLRLPEGLDCR